MSSNRARNKKHINRLGVSKDRTERLADRMLRAERDNRDAKRMGGGLNAMAKQANHFERVGEITRDQRDKLLSKLGSWSPGYWFGALRKMRIQESDLTAMAHRHSIRNQRGA